MAIVTLTALLATGCTAAATHHSPAPSSATTATGLATSASPPSGGTTVSANSADNGRTLVLQVGDNLLITLSGPTWQFAPLTSHVLDLLPEPSTTTTPTEAPSCGLGQVCGSVSDTFEAKTAGRVEITATRRICGEVELCTATNGRYHVTIVVR